MRCRACIIAGMVFLVSGCAGMPRTAPDISHCGHNDLDCINQVLDATRFAENTPSGMTKFMEGYQPASLVELKEKGRLKVHQINPLAPVGAILFAGPLAYTKIQQAKYGDVYSAEIYYPAWMPGSNLLYAHEAMHAQGTWGGYLHGSPGDYSPEQKEIMEREGVARWTETGFYKNEDDTYHWKEGVE